ncbi:hypothetical protein LOTGIDRAFT_175984, partial [Lottia gigantea]
CHNGIYGTGCLKLCSDRNCLVETSPCNHINGSCQGGCKEEFSGIDCVKRQYSNLQYSNDQSLIIIGTILGLLIGLVAGALMVVFIMKRRSRSRSNQSQIVSTDQSSSNIPQPETTTNQPVTQLFSNISNNQDNPYGQLTTAYQNENAYELLGKAEGNVSTK